MKLVRGAVVAVFVVLGSAFPASANPSLRPPPHNAQTALVRDYLRAMRDARYDEAYGLLNANERAYYRDAQNLQSIYAADSYRLTRFVLLGARGDDTHGRVYFARETARFRDHAHELDLTVTATVPVGVIRDGSAWRIKDPGHPWRAFATHASTSIRGVRVAVKKISFFERRIEAVVSFINAGERFVTILPYGKSILLDAAGRPYRIIETRDWALTDKTLFEGLRLAPDAQYTGVLNFVCEPIDNRARTFSLTISPLLIDGADAPFSVDVDAIAAAGVGSPANR